MWQEGWGHTVALLTREPLTHGGQTGRMADGDAGVWPSGLGLWLVGFRSDGRRFKSQPRLRSRYTFRAPIAKDA